MEEENFQFEELDSSKLQEIFSNVLGVKVDVVENEDNVEKTVFVKFIETLEPIIQDELKVFELGFDLSTIVAPYMGVIDLQKAKGKLILKGLKKNGKELIDFRLLMLKRI